MKYFIMILLSVSFAASCANVPRAVLSFQNRQYRFCEDAEALYWKKAQSAVGLVCWRYCKEWKLWREQTHVNCKEWATDVLDLRDERDYLKFRNAGFLLMSEESID